MISCEGRREELTGFLQTSVCLSRLPIFSTSSSGPLIRTNTMALCGCRGSRRTKSSKKDGMSNILESSLSHDQKLFYETKGREAWDQTWEMLHTDTGWKHMRGSDPESGIVHCQTFKGIGKLFKLQGTVLLKPDKLFREMVVNMEQCPKWNPTVLESKVIEIVDDETDVCHNISAEAAGGLISKRDFVSVRHWKKQDGILVSATCGVEHPSYPASRNYVRGVNKPGGVIFKPIPSDADACDFIWLMGTDLKGWIPHAIIDRAIPSMLIDSFSYLTNHVQNDFIITPSAISSLPTEIQNLS